MLTSSLDWRLSLKPCIQRSYWNFDFMDEPDHEAEESVGRASKRQQGDTSYLSPGASRSDPTCGINLKDKVRYLS